MSKENDSSGDWPIEVIKWFFSIGVFAILSLLLGIWDLHRQEVIGTTETPGVIMYVSIPLVVAALVVGASVFIDSTIQLGSMVFTSARARNVD